LGPLGRSRRRTTCSRNWCRAQRRARRS
jgi:hypothetical protein